MDKRLKISDDDFYTLELGIHSALDKYKINLDDYAKQFTSEIRMLWDLFWLANDQLWHDDNGNILPVKRTFYFYPDFNDYKDTHIDSALRLVVKNIRAGILIANPYNGLVIHKALQKRCYTDVTLIIDGESYNGELLGLSDNVYSIGKCPVGPKLGLMFVGDDVWKIDGQTIYIC